MAKKVSRLKETDFSKYNLRDAYITDQSYYLSLLRNEALFSNYGLQVLVRIPIDENGQILVNNVDEYNNFVNQHWLDTVESVVPNFKEWRAQLSEEGNTADGFDAIYPLTVLIPTTLFLPRDSRIVFNEYDADSQKIAREWTVLSVEQKQLSNGKTYAQVANCVPARKESYNNTDTINKGEFWFSHNKPVVSKVRDISAQGTIWFLKDGIDLTKVFKGFADGISEQIPEYPDYSEYVKDLMYYPTQSEQIINPGKGFEVGEEYILLDSEGYPIVIDIDQEEAQVGLSLIIKEVDEQGGITKFDLNTERGYTKFIDSFNVTFGKDKNNLATINIKSNSWIGSIYQETLQNDIIKNPKYAFVKEVICEFVSKTVPVSILN